MLRKSLEKTAEIIPQEISETAKNHFELEYYLVESELQGEESELNVKGYGVEIIKKENGCVKETAIIKNIFCDRSNIEELLEKLSEHTVTPITLPYIIDDIIGF